MASMCEVFCFFGFFVFGIYLAFFRTTLSKWIVFIPHSENNWSKDTQLISGRANIELREVNRTHLAGVCEKLQDK